MKQAGWLQGNRRDPSGWLRLITGCWGIICHIFCRCRHEPTSSARSPAGGLVGGAAGTGGASGGFSKPGGASAGGPSAAPTSAAADSDSTAPSPDGAVTVVVSPTPGSKTGKPWLAHICMHICLCPGSLTGPRGQLRSRCDSRDISSGAEGACTVLLRRGNFILAAQITALLMVWAWDTALF